MYEGNPNEILKESLKRAGYEGIHISDRFRVQRLILKSVVYLSQKDYDKIIPGSGGYTSPEGVIFIPDIYGDDLLKHEYNYDSLLKHKYNHII